MITKGGQYYYRQLCNSMLLWAWVKPKLKVVGLVKSLHFGLFLSLPLILMHVRTKRKSAQGHFI